MQCLSQEDSGAYVRAICEYMYYGKEPRDLPHKADRFYMVTKLSLELSRKRKKAGAKGGKANGKKKQKTAAKTKIETEQETTVESEQEDDTASTTETVQETATESEQTSATTTAQVTDTNEQSTTAVTEQNTTVETEQVTVSAQEQENTSDTAQEVAAEDSGKEYTLESIEEFGCYGNINPNDNILKGVDYRELYYFVKATKEAHNLSKYKAVKIYRNQHQI